VAKDINDPAGVTVVIQQLEPNFATLVDAVRQLILAADPRIGEQIKWNSPSFFYTGEMQPFNPKEYKRDIIVMHLRKGVVLLVFPTGAVIPDTTRLLEGDYADGRRMITFRNRAEVEARKEALQTVIRQWLAVSIGT
jgi:hypothetical protein